MNIYGGEVNKLIEELGHLPGIGSRTAQRLAFHIIGMPEDRALALAAANSNAKKNIRYCKECFTITDKELCPVCSAPNRNHKMIMVVESPRDMAAYERIGKYEGVYHVLHGVINPSQGIGPQEIRMKELLIRLRDDVDELIVIGGGLDHVDVQRSGGAGESFSASRTNKIPRKIRKAGPAGGDRRPRRS